MLMGNNWKIRIDGRFRRRWGNRWSKVYEQWVGMGARAWAGRLIETEQDFPVALI